MVQNKIRKIDGTIFGEDVYDNDTLKVRGDKPWLLKLYVDDCRECKELTPELKKFHEEHGDVVNVIKLNCSIPKNEEVTLFFSAYGHPMMLYMLPDTDTMYKKMGFMTAKEIEEWTIGGGYKD